EGGRVARGGAAGEEEEDGQGRGGRSHGGVLGVGFRGGGTFGYNTDSGSLPHLSLPGGRPMTDAFLLSAARTPIGKYLGGLADVPAPQLGAAPVAQVLRRPPGAPHRVDEVILGNAIQPGLGQNPARQAALAAGLPDTIAAFTVNKVCGSGLKAVMLAAQAIRAGDADVVVAGGMESMSRAPYLLFGARA